MTNTSKSITPQEPDADLQSIAADLLWGVADISKAINRNERQTYYLLESGHIPTAKKIGCQWVASRKALLRFLLEGLAGPAPASPD